MIINAMRIKKIGPMLGHQKPLLNRIEIPHMIINAPMSNDQITLGIPKQKSLSNLGLGAPKQVSSSSRRAREGTYNGSPHLEHFSASAGFFVPQFVQYTIFLPLLIVILTIIARVRGKQKKHQEHINITVSMDVRGKPVESPLY